MTVGMEQAVPPQWTLVASADRSVWEILSF